MRVLLDESVPRRLKTLLADHDVSTAQEMGWAGFDNGALLRLAADAFDVFVTADRGVEHQQNVDGMNLGVVILIAESNRFEAYAAFADRIAEAVSVVKRGHLVKVSS